MQLLNVDEEERTVEGLFFPVFVQLYEYRVTMLMNFLSFVSQNVHMKCGKLKML